MRILSAATFLAPLCLAVACSGGGSDSSAPTDSTPDTEPTGQVTSGIPALPGLLGYDIPEVSARGALALADEAREESWASETEELIVAEVSELIDVTMDLVAVECRTTWCGMVVDLPIGGDVSISGPIGDRLQEIFDLNGVARVTVYRLDGSRWIAVYVEIRRLV